MSGTEAVVLIVALVAWILSAVNVFAGSAHSYAVIFFVALPVVMLRTAGLPWWAVAVVLIGALASLFVLGAVRGRRDSRRFDQTNEGVPPNCTAVAERPIAVPPNRDRMTSSCRRARAELPRRSAAAA